MLNRPNITQFSTKFHDTALIVLVTLMYIGLCAEADMYVPAFPQMIEYFNVSDSQIQLILSINFAGLCIAGIIAGPLSDSFGRRPVLLFGLGIFSLSSTFCIYASDFNIMIFWRFIQGTGAAVPMVVGMSAFLDKYSQEKAGQLIGIINSIISASMAGAPIAGAWVSQYFGWRANFVAIFIVATILLLGTWFLIAETLPQTKRCKFNVNSILNNYLKILSSFDFVAYSILSISAFTCIVVYVANLSIIFINYMGMDLIEFSYWQASTMGTFIIFSLLSAKIINIKGLDFTQNLGSILALIGAMSIFGTAIIDQYSVYFICLSMAFIAAGGALFSGAYGLKAISLFPSIKGSATAILTAIRQLSASATVIFSEIMFDGTIVPIAKIIFGYAILATMCYGILNIRTFNKYFSQNK